MKSRKPEMVAARSFFYMCLAELPFQSVWPGFSSFSFLFLISVCTGSAQGEKTNGSNSHEADEDFFSPWFSVIFVHPCWTDMTLWCMWLWGPSWTPSSGTSLRHLLHYLKSGAWVDMLHPCLHPGHPQQWFLKVKAPRVYSHGIQDQKVTGYSEVKDQKIIVSRVGRGQKVLKVKGNVSQRPKVHRVKEWYQHSQTWHLPWVCWHGSGLRCGLFTEYTEKKYIIIGEIFVARKSQLDICEDAALLISMCRTTPTTRAQSWECGGLCGHVPVGTRGGCMQRWDRDVILTFSCDLEHL